MSTRITILAVSGVLSIVALANSGDPRSEPSVGSHGMEGPVGVPTGTSQEAMARARVEEVIRAAFVSGGTQEVRAPELGAAEPAGYFWSAVTKSLVRIEPLDTGVRLTSVDADVDGTWDLGLNALPRRVHVAELDGGMLLVVASAAAMSGEYLAAGLMQWEPAPNGGWTTSLVGSVVLDELECVGGQAVAPDPGIVRVEASSAQDVQVLAWDDTHWRATLLLEIPQGPSVVAVEIEFEPLDPAEANAPHPTPWWSNVRTISPRTSSLLSGKEPQVGGRGPGAAYLLVREPGNPAVMSTLSGPAPLKIVRAATAGTWSPVAWVGEPLRVQRGYVAWTDSEGRTLVSTKLDPRAEGQPARLETYQLEVDGDGSMTWSRKATTDAPTTDLADKRLVIDDPTGATPEAVAEDANAQVVRIRAR